MLTRNWVSVMKRYDFCIRPHHPCFNQLIWSLWILGIRLRQEWHVIWLGVAPSFFEIRVPEREVSEAKRLPNPILFDVLVLVDSSFPPLPEASWMLMCDAGVRSSGHESPHPTPSPSPLLVDIDDLLHHGVIEQVSKYRTIPSFGKFVPKSVDVETFDTFLLPISTTQEFYESVWVIGEEINHLQSSDEPLKAWICHLTS